MYNSDNTNINTKSNTTNFNNNIKIEKMNNIRNIKDKEKNCKNSGNGNMIMVRKRFVKNIEFEKFLHKNYVITNFKSK